MAGLLRKVVVLGLICGLVLAAWAFHQRIAWFFSQFPQIETVDQGVTSLGEGDDLVKPVVEGLIDPRDFVFLPDGGLLVAERGGVIRHVGNGQDWATTVDQVYAEGEAGLLGLAVSPSFSQNGLIYAYYSSESDGIVTNRVVSYRLDGTRLLDRTTVLQGIPGGLTDNGGALGFGRDGQLYVATGDAGNSASSQDQTSLAGKILRLNKDGTLPGDNPAGNLVWASGFHDPRGLTWDGTGHLWVVDRGTSGWLGGHDEVNQVEPAKNYGWPEALDAKVDVAQPKATSGSLESWEPSGLAYLRPYLYYVGTRGETLYSIDLSSATLRATGNFQRQFGRLRAVQIGPDGAVYVLTSNTDGHGLKRSGDDRVYRIDPKLLGR